MIIIIIISFIIIIVITYNTYNTYMIYTSNVRRRQSMNTVSGVEENLPLFSVIKVIELSVWSTYTNKERTEHGHCSQQQI